MHDNTLQHSHFMAMGTRLDVILTEIDSNIARFVLNELKRVVEQTEQALSCYRNSSALFRLNQQLAINDKAFVEDDLLLQAFTSAKQMHQLTHGLFDVSLGQLLLAQKDQKFVDENITYFNGMDQVTIDTTIQQLRCKKPGIQFDFGGLGKGIALEKCRAVLEHFDVQHALLSFGSSSILALGNHPHGEYWPISVCHPFKKTEPLDNFALSNNCLTISSSISHQENTLATHRPHLFNPKSGNVVKQLKSVAVVSQSAIVGEALSSAFLVVEQNNDLENLINDQAIKQLLQNHKIYSFDQQAPLK